MTTRIQAAHELAKDKVVIPEEASPLIRKFLSGATRDTDTDKLDPEGFFSPIVLKRYMEYMHQHRKMADGSTRDSDNWQRGIPIDAYMKSLWRHLFDVWCVHRGVNPDTCLDEVATQEDALCGVIFNAMGYLYELLKEQS